MKGSIIASCSGTTAGTFTWDSDLGKTKYCDGIDWRSVTDDPCLGIPIPGTQCASGAVFLGTLNGSKYMTTPGGCGEIPGGKIDGGSGSTAYPSSDFTPTCSGTDALTKTWNDGSGNWYSTGATNAQLGDGNTSTIAAITAAG